LNFLIPRIKDEIELLEDWSFPLFREYHNNEMVSRVDPTIPPTFEPESATNIIESILCTLPTSTVLAIVTMANTRQGNCKVTLKVKHHPGDEQRPIYHKPEDWYSFGELPTISGTPQKLKNAKFWVRIRDLEEAHFRFIATSDRPFPSRKYTDLLGRREAAGDHPGLTTTKLAK
jgi:hypothetical protein